MHRKISKIVWKCLCWQKKNSWGEIMVQSLRSICPRWLLSFHFCQVSLWFKEKKSWDVHIEKNLQLEDNHNRRSGKTAEKHPAFDFDLPQKCFFFVSKQCNEVEKGQGRTSCERYWIMLVTIVLFIWCRCFVLLCFLSPWILFPSFPDSLVGKKRRNLRVSLLI